MNTLYLCPANNTVIDVGALQGLSDTKDAIVVLYPQTQPLLENTPDETTLYYLQLGDKKPLKTNSIEHLSWPQFVELSKQYSKIITWYL